MMKCKYCHHMKMRGRAAETRGNIFLKGPRGMCHCEHPKAIETFEKVCPRSPRTPAFIAFTTPGENFPAIKTAPRWCPLRTQKSARP